MTKYRVISKVSKDGVVIYYPQYREFLKWWHWEKYDYSGELFFVSLGEACAVINEEKRKDAIYQENKHLHNKVYECDC
jgi:hypothetical protein